MESLPPNLTVEALALSPAETKTYLRWYTDLLLRKRGETIAVNDAMAFVDNFGLSELDKNRILKLFGGQMVTVEPAQFYAFLRLCGHAKQGRSLRRELAFVSAPVPKPRSILSKRKASEGVDRSDSPDSVTSNPFRKTSGGAKDIDTFMSLMTGKPATTGSSNGHRKKRVTFDSGPPQVAEAAQRSMEELLRQRGVELPVAPSAPPPPILEKPQEDEPDVAINPNSHFAQVNIDSVLVHGTSVVPPAPPPRRLTPNMTGPTQMVQIGVLAPETSLSAVASSALQPNHTGQLPVPAFPAAARQSSPQILAPQAAMLSQPYPAPSYQNVPSPQNLSPMPTGLEFLNSVSRSSPQNLSPANTGYARPTAMAAPVTLGNDYDIAPPPPFRRAANPYDTQAMRNQVNNLW